MPPKKQQKKLKIILVIVIGIIMINYINQQQKTASPGLSADRTFDSYTVNTEATITATYTPETYNYFGIIEEVPAGWTPSRTVSPDGKLRLTADGTGITITWTAPASPGTYDFIGTYFVYPDETYTAFTIDTVTVVSPSCTTDANCPQDTQCKNYYCNISAGECASTNINDGGACNTQPIGNTGICSAGTCVCGDTCYSLSKECGTWVVCGTSTTCGSCIAPEECDFETGICADPAEDCTNPAAVEGQYVCYEGDIDKCDSGMWVKQGDCQSYTGYTIPCVNSEPKATEELAIQDCTYTQTCDEAGYMCCDENNGYVCQTEFDYGGCASGAVCCDASACVSVGKTCEAAEPDGLGGEKCAAGEECAGGTMVPAADTVGARCCLDGTCQAPEQSCEEINDCEPWEQCNDTEDGCEIASWVWMVGAIMIFMLFWSMIK